jgi:hypothetical protein
MLVLTCHLLNSDPATARRSLFGVRRPQFFTRPVSRTTWSSGVESNRRRLHEIGEGVTG